MRRKQQSIILAEKSIDEKVIQGYPFRVAQE
jgi:hypothetical protein